MIYYLVALLDSKSYKKVELIQRDICTKYNLFTPEDSLPTLHITLETINEPNLEALDKCIKEVLKNYSFFEATCDGIICFDPPHKSVNLNILKGGVLEKLSLNFNTYLKVKGFKVRDDIFQYKLHISLANSYFSNKQWTNMEYEDACIFAQKSCCNLTININELQLWKPINDKKDMVVYTYFLNNK